MSAGDQGSCFRQRNAFTEALDAIEADHEFLARGDVMPTDLIESYVEVKRRECDEVQRTPHPVEFQLYLGL